MEQLNVSTTLPAAAEELYKAWLNSKEHSAFTGSEANCSAKKGGTFTAWDDYIAGKNIELVPHSKIIQSWRTTEFADSDPDSVIHVLFEPAGKNKTKLTILHFNIPNGQGDNYKKGWKDFYFTPMKEYYKAKTQK
jgi:activator of HSP90 ATPase